MTMSTTHADLLQRTAFAETQARSRGKRWLDGIILFTPLLSATFLAKIAPPVLGGARGLAIAFPLIVLALGLGLATRRLQLVPHRLAFFLLMLSVLGMVQVVRGDGFSMLSVVLMAAVGLAFVPALRADGLNIDAALRFFCNVSAFIALLGIVQFALQFVLGPEMAFPIETYIPREHRVLNINDRVPLYYGAAIFKANGVVMMEPSVFSQLCALGLTAELIGRNRATRLLVYGAALVVSYSGTGLLVLAVTLPLVVILHERWDLLVRGLIFAVVLALFADPLNLDVTLRRTGEFASSGSSAAARFTSWRVLFDEHLWNSPQAALFGHGAGTYADMAADYGASEMVHSKIIFEFGVLGGTLYLAFIIYCMLSSGAPWVLRIGMVITYFMNGAYTPATLGIAMSLLLWPRQVRDAPVATTELVDVSFKGKVSSRAKASPKDRVAPKPKISSTTQRRRVM
jgi:hypothetical protein